MITAVENQPWTLLFIVAAFAVVAIAAWSAGRRGRH